MDHGSDRSDSGHPSRQGSTDLESQQRNHEDYDHDGGSDDDLTDDEDNLTDESYDALEDRFHGLEEDVAILVADVHDLALYTKLNITGFMKILKVSYFQYDIFSNRSLIIKFRNTT